jgi:uncharacterized membrane protein
MSTKNASPLYWIVILLTLIAIQFTLGKKGAFPYGVIVGLSPVLIGIIVVLCDFALIPFASRLIRGTQRIGWLERKRRKLELNEEKMRRWPLLQVLQKAQFLGVAAVVATPLAGGVWTGAVLSHLFGLKTTQAYLSMGVGAVVGSAIFVLSFLGLVHWVS